MNLDLELNICNLAYNIESIIASSFMYTRQPKNGMNETTNSMHEVERKALETKQQNFSLILPS